MSVIPFWRVSAGKGSYAPSSLRVLRGTCPLLTHGVHSAIQVEVTTPEEHMGDVIGDLNSRRGMVGEFVDKVCLLSCPHFL